jgi:beta-galactosidase
MPANPLARRALLRVTHHRMKLRSLFAFLPLGLLSMPSAPAAPLTIAVPSPAAPQTDGFNMGTARHPSGATIALNSQTLLRDGHPWMPVMGEFHYSRYPESEWREELLKMKAGGIDIVATYVFWIHHEELEGEWDWSGQRDLRRFIELCGEVGVLAAVRCGPWCHGEVRNGGIPDWAASGRFKVRSDDPAYLEKARLLYEQIGAQLKGLLWKDGGPVVAIQVDNEYGGPAEHLLSLKRLAREAGLDVPLYTRTGWPALRTPMPFGEIAPLFGAYAEGFWDRALTSMPGRYWAAFQFLPVRTDTAIANEQLGPREAQDEADAHRYPYLTCELGGGMMNSYHRRIFIHPADVDTVALVKVGSGGNMPGYYMYHGGTNPQGKRTTLMEAQDTLMTNWNDLPVKSYDFQAPLGEYGQLRPHYHSLRRLHLLARDFGRQLAAMPAVFPDMRPKDKTDADTLRWSVRSDGTAGFVFVSNYQRALPMPAKRDVQFQLRLSTGGLTFPSQPVEVPADARFVWPFHLELGHGVHLDYATAQPICSIEDGDTRTVFFAANPLGTAEFAFGKGAQNLTAASGNVEKADARTLVRGVRPSRQPALTLSGRSGRVQIVLLDEADSLALWRGEWLGRERVVLSRAAVVFDQDVLRVTSEQPGDVNVGVFPSPENMSANAARLASQADGVFRSFTIPSSRTASANVQVEMVKNAGPARDIPLGKIKTPVAAAPGDADFAAAAVWKISVPKDADLAKTNPLLRLHYRGDVARVLIGGRFITDDFYNGKVFDLGLQRHAAELAAANGELSVAILPLRPDAPIFLSDGEWPKAEDGGAVATLDRVEIVSRHTTELRGAKP